MPGAMRSANEPVRRADRLIYLDIDGVLHHENLQPRFSLGAPMRWSTASRQQRFDWAGHLSRLLEPHPDVMVVLSSHWCVRLGSPRTLKRLPEELRRRVIGSTVDRYRHVASSGIMARFELLSRGQQVWADVCARKPQHWLALDDDVHGWPDEAAAHLIPCDGDLGLSSAITQRQVRDAIDAWAAHDVANWKGLAAAG